MVTDAKTRSGMGFQNQNKTVREENVEEALEMPNPPKGSPRSQGTKELLQSYKKEE